MYSYNKERKAPLCAAMLRIAKLRRSVVKYKRSGASLRDDMRRACSTNSLRELATEEPLRAKRANTFREAKACLRRFLKRPQKRRRNIGRGVWGEVPSPQPEGLWRSKTPFRCPKPICVANEALKRRFAKQIDP